MAKVNDTLETLEKREEFVQRKMDDEITKAKKFSAAGKKREALQCIKKKKMYEKQIESLVNTKMTLENQKMTMEGAPLGCDEPCVTRRTCPQSPPLG